MFKPLFALAALAAALSPAHAALSTGDLAFTSFNADEDGFSLVSFVDIAANTQVYFSDNEFVLGAFNAGESFSSWNSGASVVAAGTVVRFSNVDKVATLTASVGTLARETVSGSSNYGLAAANETLYAYLGSSASAPTVFLAAITNGDFAVDGPLVGTGLTAGSSNAIRLNSLAPTATPDYGVYSGARSGLTSLAAYQPLIANLANWTVDTTNGVYAGTVPDTTAFAVTPVPEPESYALMLSGLAALGLLVRRRA